jgi:adenylosuccinate lyase
LSHQAARVVKEEGKENDLIDRIKTTEYFKPIWADLNVLMDPSTFVGRAPQQVVKFLANDVKQALEPYRQILDAGNVKQVELNV